MDKPGYNSLLDLISWYFETIEAMSAMRLLLLRSDHKQPTKRYGAYRRLAIMAGEAESDLREMIK